MKMKPVEIKDKLGRTIVLRSPTPEDAEDLIRYMKITAGESPYLLREPDEIAITHEREVSFIQYFLDARRSLMLIATMDGKHIGNCSISPVGSYRRYAHRCEAAIALYREFWGCGIGRKMMETALEQAKALGFEQVELEVVSDNARAIALYERLGFQKYGSFPAHMKYAGGQYASADWMMKKL